MIRKRKKSEHIGADAIPKGLVYDVLNLGYTDKLKSRMIAILSILIYHRHREDHTYEIETGSKCKRMVEVKKGESWISIPTLIERVYNTFGIKLTREQVKYALRLLLQHGLISVKEATGGVSKGHFGNIYTFRETDFEGEFVDPVDFVRENSESEEEIWYADYTESRYSNRVTVREGAFHPIMKSRTLLKTHVLRNHPDREKATKFYPKEIVVDIEAGGYRVDETERYRRFRLFVINRAAKFARKFRARYGGKVDICFTGGRGIHLHITGSVLNVPMNRSQFDRILKEAIVRMLKDTELWRFFDPSTLNPFQLAGVRGKLHDKAPFDDWVYVKRTYQTIKPLKAGSLLSSFEEAAFWISRSFVRKAAKGNPFRTYSLVKEGLLEGEPWSDHHAGRDTAAFCMACDLLEAGYMTDQVLLFLKDWDKKNKPSLGDKIIAQKVRSARRLLARKGKLKANPSLQLL
ncbi:hypothetical protein Rm378p005 [Rhodothermus phage RM378]|uniref:hypothetical protein n=1 Tax=Rhodothermus phage RM378 TaxID=148943 RepID=UPI00000381A8|nr:hypothetical protein Rm378p005 [Rhodothermus phage RM378]